MIRARFDETKILPKFVYYYTLSTSYEEWKNQIFIQATIQNISAEKYANLLIPVPPLSEQEDIVKYLDAKCKNIDELLAVLKKQMRMLQDLKHRFISDVVTGKIDVRQEVIPEYEPVNDESDDEEYDEEV
ncbi:restriction endonuclease subunit S [Faecalimonas sp.]